MLNFFHQDDFRVIMNEHSRMLVQKLSELSAGGREEDLYPHLTYCTMDVICHATLGRHYNSQETRAQTPFLQSVLRASDIIFYRMRSPWAWSDALFRLNSRRAPLEEALGIMHGASERAIREKKELRRIEKEKDEETDGTKGGKRRLAFLDLLLEYSDGGKVLSDADIREEVRRRWKKPLIKS